MVSRERILPRRLAALDFRKSKGPFGRISTPAERQRTCGRFAASGEVSYDALFGMAGLVAGSWLDAKLSGVLKNTVEKWGDLGKLTLAEVLHIPRGALVVVMAVLLTAALVALERFFPR